MKDDIGFLNFRFTGLVWLFCACIFITSCANPLFFYPTAKEYGSPEKEGIPFEKVTFYSGDKTRLLGWFMPATGGPEKGTIVQFHGNAQNMSAHFNLVKWLPRKGYNVFVFDYRGYGRSDGKAVRKGIYEDCVAALQWISRKKSIDTRRIIVLGQSLGGALALRVVSDHPEFNVRAVVADSAFASYRMITRDKVKQIPVLKWFRWPLSFLLATNTYSPIDAIHQLSPTPVLIIHGTDDQVISCDHARLLYAEAHEPKYIWIIDGGKHIDAFQPYHMRYRKALLHFLDQVLKDPKKAK